MNRLERICSILVQLQSRSIITAQQIATRYNVSLRTVYRDIKTLEEAGIPIIGNTGVGYSLVEGYRLPPLMFTQEEAIAFLTAEKFIEQMTDTQNVMYYKSGMNKIKAVLRYVEKDYLSNIENNITVLSRNTTNAVLPADITQCILKSISSRKIIHIHYTTADKISSERNIEPIGCFYSDPSWYLIAYCKLRQEYRNFRVDRIKSFRLRDESFSRTHLSLVEYMEKYKFSKGCHEVVLSVPKEQITFVLESREYYGHVEKKHEGNTVKISYRVFDLELFARWFISIADIANIEQPEILKEKVREFYNKIQL